MPISREEYDAGGYDAEQALLEFLRQNDGSAFTASELLETFSDSDVAMMEVVVTELLQSLESRGRIESKVVRGRVYYTYRRSIGFLPR